MENATMHQPARRAAVLHRPATAPSADIIPTKVPSIYNKVGQIPQHLNKLELNFTNDPFQAWCQVR